MKKLACSSAILLCIPGIFSRPSVDEVLQPLIALQQRTVNSRGLTVLENSGCCPQRRTFTSPAGAVDSSPRRKPWVWMPDEGIAPEGAADNPVDIRIRRHGDLSPLRGLICLSSFSPGLRPGLESITPPGFAVTVHATGPLLTVASKAFTESVILGDMAAILAKKAGAEVSERRELGGTQVLWNALLKGEIDLYPEYTGTITQEILPQLGTSGKNDEQAIRSALQAHGILMSRSLGFNDTYAIGMKEEVASRLHIETISDLRRHGELSFGFSNEFMDRGDGWPGLRARYALPQSNVRGMDHELAYRALESGAIHATDLYSTDAEIEYHKLRVLRDDLGYFPQYEAVLLYRADAVQRAPEAIRAILQLEGRIPGRSMIQMNARAKIEKVPEDRIASEFLAGNLGVQNDAREQHVLETILQRTKEHLLLVIISLTAAIIVSVPLGIFATKFPRAGQIILALTGVIQTIPSLALLVFMIPLLGIGGPPAIVALFLYSLLPIVRNTYTGIRDIAPSIRESAAALGLPEGPRLRLIELPIASRSILGGIKTSAVINVGTATLGALIGAGGYGQPILTGIRLDDIGLILQGAVPAAVLALLVQGLFELAERVLVPIGLRLKSS